MNYNFIDLFAGAGGLSEGFIKSGFEPVAHIEMDRSACKTLKTRAAFHYLRKKKKLHIYNSYLKGEISREDLYKEIPKSILNSIINKTIGEENNKEIQEKIDLRLRSENVDLIIGGPPCQAYSLAGRSRSETKMKDDPRNFLFEQYSKYLERYNPKMFVFENVMGLLSANRGNYLSRMKSLFDKKGFKIKLFTLKATDFGVLQNRKRVIILGIKKKCQFDFPRLDEITSKHNYTIQDLFDDLPKLSAGEGIRYVKYRKKCDGYVKKKSIRNGSDILTQHITRPNNIQDKKIYEIAVKKWNNNKERINYNDLPEKLKSHKNRSSFGDRFKVVAADMPFSHTVVAHIAKDGHYYIHPDIRQNRSLSVREAARIQSFPDDYFFESIRDGSNRTAAFKQIGNAVPPLMAQSIAREIMKVLRG